MVPLRSVLWGVGGSLLVLMAGAVSYRYEQGYAASIPLYLFVTLLIAWRGGFRASVLVAATSTVGLDYFFTNPRLTFRVASFQDIAALFSFASVALLVSHLSNRIKNHAERLSRAEKQQRALYELSRSALLIDWNVAVGDQFCLHCQQRLGLSGIALWLERESEFSYAGDASDAQECLQASFRAERTSDIPVRLERIRILRFGVRPIGTVYFRGHIDPLMADAVATLIATHLERVRALRAEVSAATQAMSERLRTAVLDGLAHAVKTPLTTILISSSGLQEIGELTPLQHQLAGVIDQQVTHLATLTDKLLRTSKLEAGQFELQRKRVDLSELVKSVLEELRVEYDVARIRTRFKGKTAVDGIDFDLMRMTLMQLIENALKYSPGGSKVEVDAAISSEALAIAVGNQGSYIAPSEREHVFERYYRSPSVEHGAPGTGIGLSVAKKAVEAHQGRIWIESEPEEGTVFYMQIPLAGAQE